jgi:hypothetical protein
LLCWFGFSDDGRLDGWSCVFMGYGFNHEQVDIIRAGLNYQFH